MRVKCIKAHIDPSKGVLGIGAHGEKPIDGLTQDKVYEAALFSMADGCQYTETYPRFLVFDDNNNWTLHKVSLFKPENS